MLDSSNESSENEKESDDVEEPTAAGEVGKPQHAALLVPDTADYDDDVIMKKDQPSAHLQIFVSLMIRRGVHRRGNKQGDGKKKWRNRPPEEKSRKDKRSYSSFVFQSSMFLWPPRPPPN
ncbi:hypothetical protein GCK72_026107 [Caenorhabditis remanei]|uniref:Uncharacterized protein n=1 Tax=Caenorhabditis remanei TaxID=31234 RepID=A0A2P4VJK5_CAERE|nr:hypothetical protein GCK72_026107 [Caenorhabditis remanei]KAF1749639.1 hypothetical protein GCK72_026107 [Caenorhabditis remanei]